MNQNRKQLARNTIDRLLFAAGWQVQSEQKINLAARTGVAVWEYQTGIGSADYILLVDRKPSDFYEAKQIAKGLQSIYDLWNQVLAFFNAFQMGSTATLDNCTFGYSDENLVSDYGYEKALINGVLVQHNVFTIDMNIT